jgi:hypothetical protein
VVHVRRTDRNVLLLLLLLLLAKVCTRASHAERIVVLLVEGVVRQFALVCAA